MIDTGHGSPIVLIPGLQGRLEWMAPATKREAKAKLAVLKVGVGYPDRWPDYSGLEVRAGDAFGNAVRSELWQLHRSLAKLDRPVDRSEWVMIPQLVNAVNLPAMNAMNFRFIPSGLDEETLERWFDHLYRVFYSRGDVLWGLVRLILGEPSYARRFASSARTYLRDRVAARRWRLGGRPVAATLRPATQARRDSTVH